MTDTLRGSCHCGAVAFTLPAASAGVVACHCGDCRKLHGNYNAMLAAPREAVRFEKDATLRRYASSGKARRGFCPTCGARLFKDNLGSDRLMVSAGAIDGDTG
ncbi:MAG: GFA family protein, partial [Paracoccaceae bacterium]